ncbi:MAG TPA: hypothetical protein VJV75_09730 [Candidatus Polarisedimenticolia bacterium]|nr:hypothetical protein [Candidatus Polarisedimenticolia bacterium]
MHNATALIVLLGAGLAFSPTTLFAQATCVNVNDCTGNSYAVNADFALSNPTAAPLNAAGPTTGGSCRSTETYRTYVTWCNQSGCTALSPASSDSAPASGNSNIITTSRQPTGNIPPGPTGATATSWAVYFSKASESHSKFRHCSALSTQPIGTIAAAEVTADCKCAGFEVTQFSNVTGIVQTSKLDSTGTIAFSALNGTVQKSLTPGKNVFEFATDLVPRVSLDSGATSRSVDWNSATTYYVAESSYVGTITGTVGRTVFSSLSTAVGAIADSGPTKPYVIKLRSDGSTQLPGAVINKPYVWIQGDGVARISNVTVCADGVRVTDLITTGIEVGKSTCANLVDDPTDVYISGNVVYDSSDDSCTAFWELGRAGTGRLNTITFTNNELGRAPNGTANDCSIRVLFPASSSARTHVYFTSNTWTSKNPIHGGSHIGPFAGTHSVSVPEVEIWSIGNRFIGPISTGYMNPGEFFSCLDMEGGIGRLTSIGDTCLLTRTDNTSDNEEYMFFQVDTDYSGTQDRRVTLMNPYLEVRLPASEIGDDSVALFNVDSPRLDLRILNPSLIASLGPGFDAATDIFFGRVDGGRSTPPDAANTFIRYSGVVNVPSGTILENNSPSYSMAPLNHVLPESYSVGIHLASEDLGSTCVLGEFKFDVGGATKEMCLCHPANTWNCAALGTLTD